MRSAPFILVLAVGVITACSKAGTEVKSGKVTFADSADQVFYGVQAPFEVNGVKRGTLYADTLYVLEDQSRFDFKIGHVDFQTETGAKQGSMKADRGRYSQRTQILEGWGNVVVKMVDGRSLSSPHIIYNQLRNEITSDTTFVAVLEGGRVNSGKGLHTDPNFAHYRCDVCGVKNAVKIPK